MSQPIDNNELFEGIERDQVGMPVGAESDIMDNVTTGRVIDVRKAVWRAIAEDMRQEYKNIFFEAKSFTMSDDILEAGVNSTVRRAVLTWNSKDKTRIVHVVCKELRCLSTTASSTVEVDNNPFPDPYRVCYLPYKSSQFDVWLIIAGAEICPRTSHLVQTQS